MAASRKIIRVFLASPGDLKEERMAASRVVAGLNQTWFSFHGYHIELVGWELTVAAFGRPQALINQDLETCEYFLGMVWKRWGTPPDDSSRYASGFEEEFRGSVERRRATGRPEISLLFKNIDPNDIRDPGPQLSRVLEFKSEIIDGRELLYEEFSDLSDFQEKVGRCISKYVQSLIASEKAQTSNLSINPGSSAPRSQIATASSSPSRENALSQQGTNFLREFITKIEAEDENAGPSETEIARFRLLGTMIGTEFTDPETLGVHDANIIFRNRAALDLSTRECRALAGAGLAQYGHENTPLWHWIKSLAANHFLAFAAAVGRPDSVRVGALSAMRDTSYRLPGEPFDRGRYLNDLLAEGVDVDVKAAALRYLSQCGIPDDLPIIRAELERNDYRTTNAAIDAIIRINLRESREKAFEALLELQPESVEPEHVREIFSDGAGIADDALKAGLGHRSVNVRLAALRLLKRRKVLEVDTAEQLLADPDRRIRLEAMTFLDSKGRSFSGSDARNLLVVPPAQSLLGTAGQPSEELLEKYNIWKQRNTSDGDLAGRLNLSIFDRDAEFILADRHFSKYGAKLRSAVGNLFEAEFDESFQRMKVQPHFDGELLDKIKNLERYVRQGHTRAGLDIICRRGSASDLALVRKVLSSSFIGMSESDLEYFRRYGEWEDAKLIIELIDSPSRAKGFSALSLLFPVGGRYQLAARTLYALGRGRLERALTTSMPSRLLTHLIAEVPDAGIVALPDRIFQDLLKSEATEVRKATALVCVRSLPRLRQELLLGNHLSGEGTHYYNVIHWLDLGISLKRNIARASARKILARTWQRHPDIEPDYMF